MCVSSPVRMLFAGSIWFCFFSSRSRRIVRAKRSTVIYAPNRRRLRRPDDGKEFAKFPAKFAARTRTLAFVPRPKRPHYLRGGLANGVGELGKKNCEINNGRIRFKSFVENAATRPTNARRPFVFARTPHDRLAFGISDGLFLDTPRGLVSVTVDWILSRVSIRPKSGLPDDIRFRSKCAPTVIECCSNVRNELRLCF